MSTLRTLARDVALCAVVIASALLVVWFVRTHVYVYSAENAGVVVDAPIGHACAGVEWRPDFDAYVIARCEY